MRVGGEENVVAGSGGEGAYSPVGKRKTNGSSVNNPCKYISKVRNFSI
jgi:hypothetical protein